MEKQIQELLEHIYKLIKQYQLERLNFDQTIYFEEMFPSLLDKSIGVANVDRCG